MGFAVIVGIVAAVGGAIASLAGFGIGSVLTPVIALRAGTKIAVAVVSIPHFVATAVRMWGLRHHVNRGVFFSFGIASAAGGLLGALLHVYADTPVLSALFGCLLVFAGGMGLTGLSQRMRFGRRSAYIAGAASGAFGGLVGNQGGIRSAALLGFDIPKESFVATATAIALVVDAARMPVYFVTEGKPIAGMWETVAIASAGVVAGTLGGEKILRRIPPAQFRRLVSLLILGLGVFVLLRLSRH
ncbi:MAG TPA: sulfite exporter TauE/SafE family protein [Bryobacteraceae bacterium]|nr:sulfite exporter TauE/SafE family protein [Bryobacteraceae bacterium]